MAYVNPYMDQNLQGQGFNNTGPMSQQRNFVNAQSQVQGDNAVSMSDAIVKGSQGSFKPPKAVVDNSPSTLDVAGNMATQYGMNKGMDAAWAAGSDYLAGSGATTAMAPLASSGATAASLGGSAVTTAETLAAANAGTAAAATTAATTGGAAAAGVGGAAATGLMAAMPYVALAYGAYRLLS